MSEILSREEFEEYSPSPIATYLSPERAHATIEALAEALVVNCSWKYSALSPAYWYDDEGNVQTDLPDLDALREKGWLK